MAVSSQTSCNESAPLLELYRRDIASIHQGLYPEQEKQLWSQREDVTEAAYRLPRQGFTLLARRKGNYRDSGASSLTSDVPARASLREVRS
jgi:hypothetical protein